MSIKCNIDFLYMIISMVDRQILGKENWVTEKSIVNNTSLTYGGFMYLNSLIIVHNMRISCSMYVFQLRNSII